MERIRILRKQTIQNQFYWLQSLAISLSKTPDRPSSSFSVEFRAIWWVRESERASERNIEFL